MDRHAPEQTQLIENHFRRHHGSSQVWRSKLSRLPGFLIIGAMRAGTTSLYRDLETHPEIFLPQHKEPNNLCHEEVLSKAGRAAYARLFWPARNDQLTGEASTAYTKLPDFPDVPRRARAVLGSELKLVYIVREPIARIRSQHHHEVASGILKIGLNDAVLNRPHLVNYSRYAMQIGAWLGAFPPEQIFVVRFEHYVDHRQQTVRDLCEFLGVGTNNLPALSDTPFNKAAGRPTASPFLKRTLLQADWYKIYTKPLIPRPLRRLAARAVNRRAPEAAETFSPAILACLVEVLATETAQFERLFQSVWPGRYTTPAYDLSQSYEEGLLRAATC